MANINCPQGYRYNAATMDCDPLPKVRGNYQDDNGGGNSTPLDMRPRPNNPMGGIVDCVQNPNHPSCRGFNPRDELETILGIKPYGAYTPTGFIEDAEYAISSGIWADAQYDCPGLTWSSGSDFLDSCPSTVALNRLRQIAGNDPMGFFMCLCCTFGGDNTGDGTGCCACHRCRCKGGPDPGDRQER